MVNSTRRRVGADPQAGHATTPWAILGIGGLVVLATRWWLSRTAVGLEVVADEAAYVGVARLVGGGGALNVGSAGTYMPGYGLLISPWFRDGVDPVDAYRMAIATNIVLGLATLALLYAIGVRITTLPRRVVAGAAAIVTTLPAVGGHARWVWSESLLTPAYLALVLGLIVLVRRPSGPRALAAATLAVLAYSVHGRMVSALAVTAVTLALLTIRREVPRGYGATALGVTVVGYVGVGRLAAAINDRIYEPGGAVSQTHELTEKLRDVPALLIGSVGQAWYLLAGTAAVAGLGLLVLGRSTVRALLDHRHERTPLAAPEVDDAIGPRLDSRTAYVLSGLILLGVATSVGFIAGQDRPDHLVYGRYNDTIVGPVLLLGIAALLQRPVRRLLRDGAAALAVLVAGGLVLRLLELPRLQKPNNVKATILGIVPLNPDPTYLKVLSITAIGAALTVAVVGVAVLARRTRHAAPIVLAGLAVLALVGVSRTDDRWPLRPWSEPAARNIEAVRDVVPLGEPIRYRLDQDASPVPFYTYQLVLHDRPLVRQLPWSTDLPDTPYSLAPLRAPDMDADGARVAYVDPYNGMALWVDAGARQDELDAEGRLLPEGFPDVALPAATGSDRIVVESSTLHEGLGGVDLTILVPPPDGGTPWPVDRGGWGAIGSVRIAVAIDSGACACRVADLRIDLPGQVDPGDDPVELSASLPFEPLDPTALNYARIQVIQEGYGPLGPETAVALGGP